jgi:hypothetical protein
MARRKSKAKARSRSRKPAFNITNAAQSFIIANAVTKGVAGTNLIPFLTEGWLREKLLATWAVLVTHGHFPLKN